MRVHLLSSMRSTKLSWHNRKFTWSLRPGGQITQARARHRLCRKASSKPPPLSSASFFSLSVLWLFRRGEIILFPLSISPHEVHSDCWNCYGCYERIPHCSVHFQPTNENDKKCLMQRLCSRTGIWIQAKQSSWLPSTGTTNNNVELQHCFPLYSHSHTVGSGVAMKGAACVSVSS